MNWFLRFRDALAVKILLRSRNITFVAFKDVESDQIFMGASPIDPIAYTFYVRNLDHCGEPDPDPDSMMLERIYHSPDAEKRQ